MLAIKIWGRVFSHADANKSICFLRRHLHNSNGGYTILEQRIINFKHMSEARIARSVDSCWTFSQRGQECTQPHLNSADTRRVCAPVCKCGTYAGITRICAWELLCSQAPSGLTTGFKPCQPVPTLYARQRKNGFREGKNTEHYSFWEGSS